MPGGVVQSCESEAAAWGIGGVGIDSYSPVRAWASVAILLIFSLFSILDRQIIALLVEPMKADLHLSDTQVGLLQGIAFALFYSLAGLPIGWAVDRFPRKVVIYLGITLWSLSAACCGLAHNFWQIFLGRTTVGVGEATLTPVAVSLIGDLFPPDRVATPYGVYSAGFYLGSGVALGVGGLVVSLFAGQAAVILPIVGDVAPWQAVFLVTGLPGVVVAFLAFLIHDPRPARWRSVQAATPGGQEGEIRHYVRTRGRVTFHSFLGFAMANFVTYAVSAWTPAFLQRQFALPPATIGWTLGLSTACSGAIGAFFGGMLIDRVFRAGQTDAYFLVPSLCGLLALPFLAGAYFMPSPILVLISLALGMSMFGIIAAASYATWGHIAPPCVRGRVSAAAVLTMALIGTGLGPVAVALVTDLLLQDEKKLGLSLAIVTGVALPLMSLLLLSGRSALRAVSEEGR